MRATRLIVTATLVIVACVVTRTAAAQTVPVVVGSWQTFGGFTPDSSFGMCLENDCTTTDQTGCIKQKPCAQPTDGTYAGRDPQQWKIDSIGEIRYQHNGSDTGLCLTLLNGNTGNGQLVLENCTSFYSCVRYCGWIYNDNQIFQWVPDANINGHTTVAGLEMTYFPGYCVDVAGGNTNSGTLIDIASCNGSQQQVWSPLYYTFTVQSGASSNTCMDLQNTTDRYVTNTCNTSSASQDFTFIPVSGEPNFHDLIASEDASTNTCGSGLWDVLGWWSIINYQSYYWEGCDQSEAYGLGGGVYPKGPPYEDSICDGGGLQVCRNGSNYPAGRDMLFSYTNGAFLESGSEYHNTTNYPDISNYYCLEVWQQSGYDPYVEYDGCAFTSAQVWKLNVLGMP